MVLDGLRTSCRTGSDEGDRVARIVCRCGFAEVGARLKESRTVKLVTEMYSSELAVWQNLFFADLLLQSAAGKAFGLPNALQPKWRAVCLGDTLHESADFSSLEVEQADTATLLFSMSK